MTQHRIDDAKLKRDATRILRALMQPGALMAVMPDVATAVVVCENSDGVPRQIATTPREVAEVMALREWIRCKVQGRISRYYITPAGRVALNRFLAETETARAGFAEAPAGFDHAAPEGLFGAAGKAARRRSVGTESPLQVLARRRDKDGAPYLGADLVEVGERLRLDFELALIGQSTGFNWDSLSTPPGGGARQSGGGNERQLAAKERLARAMRKLGPELGEVALMTCCQQQGMEAAESRMKMPARSGKYVLRIALNMLARHYRQNRDDDHDLIY